MRRLALALALLATGAGAQAPDPAAAARALEAAAAMAAESFGATDRIAALTATVRAYEDGLAALRESLRAVAARRSALEAAMAAERDDLARLLGALQSMGRSPAPMVLVHPAGPLDTARAGMVLAEITPALAAEAEALRARLQELADVESLQREAERVLGEGLAGAQDARAALAQAAADRTDLPRRYEEDPAATAALLAATETLDAFAEGLGVAPGEAPEEAGDPGPWPLPVRGVVLRGPGEPDASGVARPGLVIATAPRALVTTPAAATLRFRGPLLDYGLVAILEPAPGRLVVLAGLAEAYGEAGEVLPEGAPVGMMGGPADADAILTAAPLAGGVTGGAGLSETLYLEVREDGAPADPSAFFSLDGGPP